VLRHYQELGEHRSGTESDHATAQWLLSELENRGVNGKLQAWPLRVFHLRKSELKTQSDSFDNFPFWYPQATGPHGIQAPLTLLGSGGEDAMDGTIALIRVPPSQYEFHFNVAPELQRAADQGARGAVVILNHPMKAVSAQNTNRQWNQQELPLPALIASEADAEALLTAASNRTEITLVINGQSRLGEAMNILGKVERKSDRWLVISTPVSGWFEVTNERGPGIALWLQLAEWLVDSKLETNVLFAALSGHELSGMGMQALIDSGELPEPDSVGLWLHLGSGIAVETPLLSAASSTIALEELVQQTLTAHTAMIYWPEDKMPKGSEQYLAAQLGYPVVGLFGADPAIHTRLDQSPRINEREYNSIFKALQTLIKRRLSSTNHPHQKTAQ
jgi:hypothetical protein